MNVRFKQYCRIHKQTWGPNSEYYSNYYVWATHLRAVEKMSKIRDLTHITDYKYAVELIWRGNYVGR